MKKYLNDNKGFAITGIIYGLMIIFVFALSSFLAAVVGKNKRSEELLKSVYEDIEVKVINVYSRTTTEEQRFGNEYKYITPKRAKYIFYDDDSNKCGEVYLPKGIEIEINADGNAVYNSNVTIGSCSYSISSTPNSPDLVEGLIPVMYHNNTWVVADDKNEDETYKWYDYDNKQWANAVLVTEDKRNSLSKDSDGSYTMGQTIGDSETDEVLAFYVWIPRYKYKVWNISKQAGEESTYAYNAYSEGIGIVFENEKKSTGKITCSYNFNVDPDNGGIDLTTTTAETCTGSNGYYYTHPAFCLGETTDGVCSGDTLRGFWIGKFELSSSDPSADYGGGYSNTGLLTPRILPNVVSWRYNFLSNFNTKIRGMTGSSNIYGLNSTTTSSHILTNMEWGAVAYLTNSKYGRCTDGICEEISLNGYGETSKWIAMTGCGPISSESTEYDTICNAYNTVLGKGASTTGNVYGVYDMSGGAWEFIAGNTSNEKYDYIFNPNFSDLVSGNFFYNSKPKFLTTYAYINGGTGRYNIGRLGDATAEILLSKSSNGGWYGDYTDVPHPANPWFFRGGLFNSESLAGVFGFNDVDYGSSFYGYTTRPALAKIN